MATSRHLCYSCNQPCNDEHRIWVRTEDNNRYYCEDCCPQCRRFSEDLDAFNRKFYADKTPDMNAEPL